MTQGEEMLPCPFCGREGELEGEMMRGRMLWRAGCNNAECQVEAGICGHDRGYVSAQWNTRHTHPATTGSVREAVSATLLGEVMQDAWSEICDDAGAHPSDMKHGRGTVLFYSPSHWTDLIALRLSERLAASPTPDAGSALGKPGWIVGNNDGNWLTTDNFGWAWTDLRGLAIRFARRDDAEAACCGTPKANYVEQYGAPSEQKANAIRTCTWCGVNAAASVCPACEAWASSDASQTIGRSK